MLDRNISNKGKSRTLLEASREGGPEVNTEKTKYMFYVSSQNVGQKHDIINTATQSFKNVANFKCSRL